MSHAEKEVDINGLNDVLDTVHFGDIDFDAPESVFGDITYKMIHSGKIFRNCVVGIAPEDAEILKARRGR